MGECICDQCEIEEENCPANQAIQQVAEIASKLEKAYRGLESLTPGGSEFHNDVENCVDYISRKVSTLEGLVKDHAKRRIAAEQERDNLQAANGVLREALKFYANTDNYSPDIENVVGVSHDGKMAWGDPAVIEDCGEKAIQALSTTPAEAGERVRGLVEALEATRNVLYDILPVGNVTGDKTVAPLIKTIGDIDKALAKYRG